MKEIIKKAIFTVLAFGLLVVPALTVNTSASAAVSDGIRGGACFKTNQQDCPETENAESTINDVISRIIDIFSFVVGVIAVIMIILGGLRYIMSGGDSGNVTGAKNTILYAVIGIVVVIFAQVIVKFVIDKAVGSTDTTAPETEDATTDTGSLPYYIS